MTIEELKKRAGTDPVETSLHAQIESIATKQTRDQKPYLEILTKDATADFSLRVWSDHPAYKLCAKLQSGEFVAIKGDFHVSPNFGLEARNWTVRPLDPDEKLGLLAGPPDLLAKQNRDYESIEVFVQSIRDPRLHRLSALFLAEFGDRFRRAAGARHFHHARRGGLIEHVAQMMRSADALTPVYPTLNRDLLLAGILFHDAGKMWENCYGKESFVMPFDVWGELLGHLSIGVELINRLWNRLKELPEYDSWHSLKPDSEAVRLHLIHLIAAHHGERQFGSPIEPKTPEAMVLHIVDNLDAKLEMFFSAYENGQHLSPEIIERVRPLPGNLVEPLPIFSEPVSPPANEP
jgi:3'-5' exoribonuclease